jgi:hypothetical protein
MFLRECPELSQIQGGSFPEVAGKLADTAGKYYECAAFHHSLIEAVKHRIK